jgi:hypothetical protein
MRGRNPSADRGLPAIEEPGGLPSERRPANFFCWHSKKAKNPVNPSFFTPAWSVSRLSESDLFRRLALPTFELRQPKFLLLILIVGLILAPLRHAQQVG